MWRYWTEELRKKSSFTDSVFFLRSLRRPFIYFCAQLLILLLLLSFWKCFCTYRKDVYFLYFLWTYLANIVFHFKKLRMMQSMLRILSTITADRFFFFFCVRLHLFALAHTTCTVTKHQIRRCNLISHYIVDFDHFVNNRRWIVFLLSVSIGLTVVRWPLNEEKKS